MRTKTTLSVLLLLALCTTPTLANYFHNPSTNLNWNIGSAPSPTPRDVRENRQPLVTQAAPSDNAFVAEDTTKNTGKQAANGHSLAQSEAGRNLTAAQLSC